MKIKKGIDVLNILEKNNYKAYLVGGIVRDYLLNIPCFDIDITTNAKPNEIINIFDNYDKSGLNYGNIKVNYKNEIIEITTFRKEINYSDFRHPEFRFTDNILDDILRRDFTINALLMDKNLKVIDYLDGLNDLNNKIIKTIGNPDIKFKEDALRILRAIHFKAKLNFDIDKNTLNAMIKYQNNLNYINHDVILKEIKKILNDKFFYESIPDFIKISDSLNFTTPLKKIYESKIKNISYLEFFMLVYYFNGKIDYNLSKKDLIKIKKAIELANILLNRNVDNILYFNYNKEICLLANKFNMIVNKKIDSTLLILEIEKNIPIKKLGDIKYNAIDLINDFNFKENQIKIVLNEIKDLILNNNLENDYNKIKEYLLLKYGG